MTKKKKIKVKLKKENENFSFDLENLMILYDNYYKDLTQHEKILLTIINN